MSTSSFELYAPKTVPRAGSWWAASVSAMRRPIERIRHERRIRNDVDALMEFDDGALADIGLKRAEVLHAVRYGRLPNRR